ncbi:hypothetical protein EKN06_09010 [Croceicoccus ponticola]|uniref:Serine kinase n=1 Tax=Croceicoccus ponticola TaxID=2217664 RepID=A0A437GY10_9SPHN|nr:hypothetical protein [Croceicoccus ponticola]RVQ67061.1 hypothetical protein EKN06_09010 [Croceicoccus ponticola]
MTELTPAMLMMRECRVREGIVPDTLAGMRIAVGKNDMVGEEFLLRDDGLAIYYRRGDGVTVQLDDQSKAGMLELFLSGTVHSAIAALNGLTPIHASAVAIDGRAFAFSGASGAGKSTTAAALRQRGLPIVADDTLVVDLSTPAPNCLPGHKRLKLWPDSLALTGLPSLQLVSEDYRKFFATDSGSDVDAPLPLAAIIGLEIGEDPSFEPVRGAQRITLLDDDHYTAYLHSSARGHDRAGRLAALAALANRIEVFRFVRPLDPARFTESIDLLIDRLSQVSSR